MPRSARRLRIAAGLVAGALLVTACGGGEQKTPLGTLSQHDLSAISAMSADMRGFTGSYTNLIKSLQGEDVSGSRTAIKGMQGALGKASGEVTKIDAKSERTTLQGYLGKMGGVTTAADRLIAYYEKTSRPQARVANRLVANFRRSALAAHQADVTLMRNMLKHATPAQRKKLQAAFQRANQKYQTAVGS
jgi:hypothetical protein